MVIKEFLTNNWFLKDKLCISGLIILNVGESHRSNLKTIAYSLQMVQNFELLTPVKSFLVNIYFKDIQPKDIIFLTVGVKWVFWWIKCPNQSNIKEKRWMSLGDKGGCLTIVALNKTSLDVRDGIIPSLTLSEMADF